VEKVIKSITLWMTSTSGEYTEKPFNLSNLLGVYMAINKGEKKIYFCNHCGKRLKSTINKYSFEKDMVEKGEIEVCECDPDEVSVEERAGLEREGVRIVSKEKFKEFERSIGSEEDNDEQADT